MNILVADGQRFLREGLVELLSTQQDMHVVGEATCGREAAEQARLLRPDLVLMSLDLPEGALESAQRIRENHPETRIVLLLPPGHEPRLRGSLGGADALIRYDARARQIFAGLRAAAGSHPLEPETIVTTGTRAAPHLTPREEQVLSLIYLAYSNRQIKEALGIQHSTVKRHVRRILQKLEVRNRVEAAVYAAQLGVARQGASQS